MKKITRTIILLCCFLNLKAMGNIDLKLNENSTYIRVNELNDEIIEKLSQYGEVIDFQEEYIQPKNLKSRNNVLNISWVVINLSDPNFFDKIQSLEEVVYISKFIKNEKGDFLGVTGLIYAKMKSDINISELEAKYKLKVTDFIGYEKRTLKILIDKNTLFSSDGLKSELDKSLKFEFVEDALLYNFKLNCSPISSQWALNNTGIYGGVTGVDINFCQANSITSGSSDIVVAVVDEGVDLTHPDLDNNLLYEFDPTNLYSAPYGGHGTACAGIIAAEDNNIGVIGVAPSVKILSCAVKFGLAQSSEFLAESIDHSWENGADVISNSWGGGNDPLILNAIDNALNYGRNGLGCVVVFASGNDNSTVMPPGNDNPKVLVVGAMSMCGERKSPSSCDGENLWGSNYGDELDVVAPGVLIPTTDIQGNGGYNPDENLHENGGGNIYNTDFGNKDYTSWFHGTSAAAPHVSGLAALILSLDPCLTVQEVNDIIESSAQKVGGYNYTNTTGRSNGTWNNEMGYGLIDAEAALQAVLNQNFKQNETENGNLLVNGLTTDFIRAGSNVTSNIGYGDYIVSSSANVEFKAREYISLEPGFTASAGSEFLAHIEAYNGNCGEWNNKNLWVQVEEEEGMLILEKDPNEEERIEISDFNPIYFPNPYNKDLYVKYHLETDELVNIQLYNVLGKIVYSQSFNGHIGENMHKLDFETSEKMLIVNFCIQKDCKTAKLIKNE